MILFFGKNRSGNAEFLRNQALECDFGFEQIEPQADAVSSIIYSSSEIRNALKLGDVAMANKLLGREFTITGCVKPGMQLGRKLGFPTANLELKDYVRPKYGVYAVRVLIDGKYYNAVANLGVRPTITQDKVPLLEVHVFDFFFQYMW